MTKPRTCALCRAKSMPGDFGRVYHDDLCTPALRSLVRAALRDCCDFDCWHPICIAARRLKRERAPAAGEKKRP
jgi:hypothetical protein